MEETIIIGPIAWDISKQKASSFPVDSLQRRPRIEELHRKAIKATRDIETKTPEQIEEMTPKQKVQHLQFYGFNPEEIVQITGFPMAKVVTHWRGHIPRLSNS